MNYRKEIPYSCEVVIESFKEDTDIIRIEAVILVERETQKGIILGERGSKIKKIGTEARKEIEKFLGQKVFLELFVKVRPKWRENETHLREYGY